MPKALKVNGIVIVPYILFRDPREWTKDSWIKHELVHVHQCSEIGWFRFYLSYVFYWLAGLFRYKDRADAYFKHPYEIEAFEKQSEDFNELDIKILELSGVRNVKSKRNNRRT